MNFSCQGCYQNAQRNERYSCRRYSSWLRHVAGLEHAQWSAMHYHQWNTRECDSSIVVVIPPVPAGAKSMHLKLSNQEVVQTFAPFGIIQDFYMDRSGNFAVILFDDVIAVEKILGVKAAYIQKGCLEYTVVDRSCLLYPRSAPVFNETTWKFLKQNHEFAKLKTALSPSAAVEAESAPVSPEVVIIPLKSIAKQVPDDPPQQSSISTTTVNTPVSSTMSSGRVFFNSSLKLDEAGLPPGLEFGAGKFQQPSTSRGEGNSGSSSSRASVGSMSMSNANTPTLTEADLPDNLAKKKKSPRKRHGRSSSNSTNSVNGEEPTSRAKTKPSVSKTSSAKAKTFQVKQDGTDSNLTTTASPEVPKKNQSSAAEKTCKPGAGASPMNNSNAQSVNGVLVQILPTPVEPRKASNSASGKSQPGFIRPVVAGPGPGFRPQGYPIMMMPMNQGASINPFFHPAPFRPIPQLQTSNQRYPLPGPMGVVRPFIPGPVPPSPGFIPPRAPVGKDFYNLFAHILNSNMKLPKDQFRRITDDFLKLPIDSQMDSFILATTVTEKERNSRQMIVTELQYHLKEAYPNCRIYVFGSMTTHLCGTDSDIDVVVDLYGTLHSVSGTDKSVIKGVQKYLDSRGSRKRPVYYVQPILQARIPILKLTHRETKVNVDLSFENFMSVRNSNLIALYMRLDPRVRPMMVFVRYWAKFHELSGSFYIKNYAFILLVINFLSSPAKKLIPTIQQLQELNDIKQDAHCIIDGYWNAGFCQDVDKIRSMTKIEEVTKPPTWMDLLELCYGFFKMYAELDYENSVICPLIGGTLPREQFQPGHEEALPDSMERYKAYTASRDLDSRFRISVPLKLQDPFHLQFNVGSITPAHTLFTFRVLCNNMVEILYNFQTVKKRVPTVLDLMNRLPGFVTERQSFNLHHAGKQRLWLSHELATVIPESETGVPEFDATLLDRVLDARTTSDTSDLWLVRKLVEIGKATSGQRNGTLEFDIGRNFYQLFVQNLKRLNALPEPEEIPVQVKLLWAHFVIEYLNQIWSTGFHLGISKISRWSTPLTPPLDVLRMPKKWITNAPLPDDIPVPESDPTESERKLILQTLEDMVKNQKPGEVYFFRICTTECKSFFAGRKVVYRKLLKTFHKDGEGNINPTPATEGKKKKLPYRVNPIEFEGEVTTAVLQKDAHKPVIHDFKLQGYGKLDLKLDEDDVSSELHLVFKKFVEEDSSREAFDTVTRTIKDTLPNYVIHRLLNFFKVFGSEKIPTTNYPTIDFDLEETSEDEEEEDDNDTNGLENVSDGEFVIDTFEDILEA